MILMCELCELLKNKDLKIYFETEEIIIFKKEEDKVIGTFKKHQNADERKSSGLIKALMTAVSINHSDHVYSFKRIDECKDHFGICVTVKEEKNAKE